MPCKPKRPSKLEQGQMGRGTDPSVVSMLREVRFDWLWGFDFVTMEVVSWAKSVWAKCAWAVWWERDPDRRKELAQNNH